MITFDEETHTYTLNGRKIKSVTQILSEAGITDLSFINPDVLQRAADFGHAVHTMTDLYDRHDLDLESLDPALVPYLDAWSAFVRVTGWTTETTEQIVYSTKYLYAGKYDRKGLYNGKTTLLDIKTGIKNKATVKITGMQLAGYCIAHNEHEKNKVKGRAAVWLVGDGSFKMETYADQGDQARFLSCLTVAYLKEELK